MIKLEDCPNVATYEAICKTERHLLLHDNIMVALSGGADSDVVLDLILRVAKAYSISMDKFHFVFFDTGIEYQATKDHLCYLENKYGITIERVRAIKPVPLGCKQYGVPFWNKYVSDMIERLQRHNFKWEDKPFEILIRKYPKCRGALRWWCNDFAVKKGKDGNVVRSKFNINYISYLKEYMIINKPNFKISAKCCKGAKKDNAKKYIKENNIDLNCLGIRKAEGGIRATSYTSCFDENNEGANVFRPIFWFTDKNRQEYENFYGITHSCCYTKYGLKRTGCAGCPFGKDFEAELENARINEPKLHKAINSIFWNSYEYTREYLRFRRNMKIKNNEQLNIFDLIGEE